VLKQHHLTVPTPQDWGDRLSLLLLPLLLPQQQ
jgi:hypothetical protein